MELVITGVGVVSPFGVGRGAWEAGLAGAKASPNAAFREASEVLLGGQEPYSFRTAEIWGWDPGAHLGDKGHRSYDRLTRFLITAAKHALGDSRLKRDDTLQGLRADEIGICSATAYGSLDAINELNRVAELENPRYINPTRFPNTVINAAAGYVSIWEDLRGPNTTIVAGNCGSVDAMLTAETHLRLGRARAMLVGGGEVISEPLFRAFQRLDLLKKTAKSDKDHSSPDGLEMGEGASYVVVERAEDARARGATIVAEVLGYGSAFEPPNSEALLVGVSPLAVERAARGALSDAGIDASAIDLVLSAKGGIKAIDEAEEAGLRAVVGETPRVALKAIHGETFGAAGAFALAAAAAPAVLGALAGAAPPRTLLISAVGFYGNASALVLRLTANE